MMLSFLFDIALFTGGGIALMAIAGVAWGIIEDWRRERRWNHGE